VKEEVVVTRVDERVEVGSDVPTKLLIIKLDTATAQHRENALEAITAAVEQSS
jgi:hypothetical protein